MSLHVLASSAVRGRELSATRTFSAQGAVLLGQPARASSVPPPLAATADGGEGHSSHT